MMILYNGYAKVTQKKVLYPAEMQEAGNRVKITDGTATVKCGGVHMRKQTIGLLTEKVVNADDAKPGYLLYLKSVPAVNGYRFFHYPTGQ